MIKEKLKKLGCFVLAASMLLCNQMPVFADNLMSHVNIKPSQTVNLEDCSNVNLKLTVKLGNKDVTFTNGDSFEAAAGSDNAKALGAIKYYADKATDDDDFISHFSVNSTKSSANNAVMFDMMATDDGNVRALNMSSIGNNDKYFLGTGSNLDKFRNNFYVKKSGALYRFYFSSAEILNNFMVSDKAYYVDSSSKVKPISDYTSEFDFSDISAQITEDSPYPNISLKFVSGKMSTYDMSDLKYDIVLKTVNDKIVFAFPNASYLDDIKNSLINFADYNTSFFTETDVSPTEENAIKTGSILKKGVRYLVSNFNTGDEIATTNKSYNSYNIRFYDEDTNGCLESTGKGSANSSPVVSDYTPDKTYRVVSVTRESEGSFNDYYCVTVKHDHVEKTTTNKISDPTCTAKGVNELITTCTDCGTEIKHEIQYVNALGHSAGTPTKENVIPSTCTAGGSYQEITRCTRCNEILKSELKTTPALGHNFGAWTKVDDVTSELINGALNKGLFDTQAIPKILEKRTCATCGGYELIPDEIHEHSNYVTTNENVVDATCASEGGYDVVTKCGTCDEEISRTHVTTEKLAHTPGQSVVENEVKATCTTDGSYDEVVKCSVCGEELSRTARTTKALGHVNGTAVKENVVNPSCEKNGGYDEVVYCTRDEDGCNHSKLSSTHIVIPATGHPNKSARVDKVKEPTCTENGLYKAVVFCTDCNKDLTSKDIVVPATGHVAGKMTIENNVAATCETKGSYDEVVRCTKCNEVISRNTVDVAVLGHVAGEPVIENKVDPTTKKEGGYDIVVYCTRDDHGCGHKELSRKHIVIDKLKHEHTVGVPVVENKKAATCETKGGYDINVYCTDCKKLLNSTHETIPALGHNYELTKTVDATCTKDGYNLYTCKNDASHTKKDVIKATGHNYIHQTDKYTAPTCTADGKYHEFDQCASCGDVKNERWNAVEALGHTFGAWTEIADKAQLTKELFAGAVNASELNFADLGKYDHVYRSDCARNDGYKLRVDKHEHSNLVTVKENVVDATCTKTGSFDEVVKCGVCGDVVSRDKITVPVKGHVAGKAVKTVVKEADCTNKGFIKSVVSCKNCGTVLASEEYETEKLGHVSGDPVIENKVDATTKKEGSYDIVVYCTRDDHGCGHKELLRKHVVVPKLKHEHTVGSPVIENRVAATCTKDGSYDINIYCTDCKKLLNSKHMTEKAFGHNYELTKTVDATCTKDGYNLYTCKNDASHTKKDVIKATGHSNVHVPMSAYAAAGCTTEGKYTEYDKCSKCGLISNKVIHKIAPTGHKYKADGWKIAGSSEVTKELFEKAENAKDLAEKTPFEKIDVKNDKVYINKCEKHDAYMLRVDKHVHNVVPSYVIVKKPTCTETGKAEVASRCRDCGKTLSSDFVTLSALGHVAGEPVVENMVNPTEKKEGGYDIVVYCTRDEDGCNHSEISRKHVVLDKLEHKHTAGAPVIKHVTEPTCTSGGTYYANVYCTDCGELLDYTVISLPGLGHVYPQDQWIKVGSEYITKDFFDKAENAKELEKKTPFESIDKEHDSVYTVKCYRCDSYVVKVVKHVHTAGAPVMSETKKATCTEKGVITSTTSCTGCGKALESTIMETPALGHVAGEPVIENKVDPTTEKEGGYDIVVYCTRDEDGCGHKELSRKHVVIDKLKHEHTVGEPVIEVVKAATCEDKGSIKVTVSCTDCGEVLSSVTKDIPALGHNYELTKTVDATCTEDGYVLYTCKNDAEHTEKTVIKATGHEYSDPVVENKNDLKHDEVIYCAKCGEELSRKTVIDAQPETKSDAVLPETKPEEAAPAETVETPVETAVETPAIEQASETDTETAAPVTNDTSDTMTYVYVMLLGAAAVCATAVLRRKKTDIEE